MKAPHSWNSQRLGPRCSERVPGAMRGTLLPEQPGVKPGSSVRISQRLLAVVKPTSSGAGIHTKEASVLHLPKGSSASGCHRIREILSVSETPI